MSQQWGKLPMELITDPEISSGAKVLYGFLAWSASGKDRHSRTMPWSQKGLANKLHVSERSIRTWIAQLDDAGWITIEYRRNGQRNTICTYLVHPLRRKQASGSEDSTEALSRQSVTWRGIATKQEKDVTPKQEREEASEAEESFRVRTEKRRPGRAGEGSDTSSPSKTSKRAGSTESSSETSKRRGSTDSPSSSKNNKTSLTTSVLTREDILSLLKQHIRFCRHRKPWEHGSEWGWQYDSESKGYNQCSVGPDFWWSLSEHQRGSDGYALRSGKLRAALDLVCQNDLPMLMLRSRLKEAA